MKHSFFLNQKTILLVLGMTLCTLSSCNQPKVSQGQTDVVADSTAVDTRTADNSSNNPVTSDNSKENHYFEKGRWSGGYDETHASKEKLKEEFKQEANSYDSQDMGNRDLFNEYIRGYEEGQCQRNQEMKSGDLSPTELASKKNHYFEKGRWSGGYDETHASKEKLKEEFKQEANSYDSQDMGNRDLFNEYIRGYEEGQRQRNQL